MTIRGGKEHGTGIYVSHVEPGGPGDKAGLKVTFIPYISSTHVCTKVGDQLLDVNGKDFTNISHGTALLLLSGFPKMFLTVKAGNMIPTFYSLFNLPTSNHFRYQYFGSTTEWITVEKELELQKKARERDAAKVASQFPVDKIEANQQNADDQSDEEFFVQFRDQHGRFMLEGD